MSSFMYVVLDFEKDPVDRLAQYLSSSKKCVCFVHKNLYNSKGGEIKSFQIKSENIKFRKFIDDFYHILNIFLATDCNYICILPSTSFFLTPIDSFEDHILSNDCEYANIINAKYDDSKSPYQAIFNELYPPIGTHFTRKKIAKFLKLLGIKRVTPFGFMLHYGNPYGCFSKKTVLKMLEEYKNKKFRSIFNLLRHPAFFFLPSLIYKSSEKEVLPLTNIMISTDTIVDNSQYFYNDHRKLLKKAKGYFVAKISKRADTLIENLILDFNVQNKNYINFSKIYKDILMNKHIRTRIPGHYPSSVLQDLYYNKKDYTVVFTDVSLNLENFFDKHTHSLYGFLFDKDKIDYGHMDIHPCYSNKTQLRDHKQHNFLYDILKFSKNKVVFLISSKSSKEWLDVLSHDPHANFFAYIQCDYLKLINLNIKCTSKSYSCYYSCQKAFDCDKMEKSSINVDYAYLQQFLKKINRIMYTKKCAVHFLQHETSK